MATNRRFRDRNDSKAKRHAPRGSVNARKAAARLRRVDMDIRERTERAS